MSIQKTTKIASLTALVALTGASCWSATSTPSLETPIGSFARLYAEGPADLAPGILASLYRKDLLELVLIGLKEPQRFPMLYQDAVSELYGQKEKFLQLLQENNDNAQIALLDATLNNKAWAIDYLIQNGANVNAKDKHGETMLMLAARHGCEAVVAQLIAAGANVDEANILGYTALIYGAGTGHVNVVAQLIAAGANVNEEDNTGYTALRSAESVVTNVSCKQAHRDGARAVVDLLTRGR